MRKKKPIDALFSKTRSSVLAATMMQPDRWWYLSDLANHIGVRPSSLQRDLASLADAGILEKSRDRGRVYYRADRSCPFFPEIKSLIAKTAGLVDVLREAIGERDDIQIAFVYGSVARGEEKSGSDVDLAVVGDISFGEVVTALAKAQESIGREINPTVFAADEFKKKAEQKHHFVKALLDGDKLFVIGSARELERLAK